MRNNQGTTWKWNNIYYNLVANKKHLTVTHTVYIHLSANLWSEVLRISDEV